MWHEPTKRWVMVLYVGVRPPGSDPKNKDSIQHTIHFLTSPNLKDWEVTGQIEGFHECPDLFALPVDGDVKNVKWVLTAANSDYMVGTFDGRTFAPETPKIKGHLGKGFYAAQTFSDIPPSDGRRIQIGWLQTPSPGMPFSQAMSVPLELSLVSTAEGPRLRRYPVRELEQLRHPLKLQQMFELKPGENPLRAIAGEETDIRAEMTPPPGATITFVVRGVPVVYDAGKQEIAVNNHHASAPLIHGVLRLRILADRTAFEVFAADGLTYLPMPVIPDAANRDVSLDSSAPVQVKSLEVDEMSSIWRR
jgi:sucrose-6-phosphate hydrolase SacC (GH32 family)